MVKKVAAQLRRADWVLEGDEGFFRHAPPHPLP